jgi:hypothetical protein
MDTCVYRLTSAFEIEGTQEEASFFPDAALPLIVCSRRPSATMSLLSSDILPTKLQGIIHNTVDGHGNPSEYQTTADGHRNERTSAFHPQ